MSVIIKFLGGYFLKSSNTYIYIALIALTGLFLYTLALYDAAKLETEAVKKDLSTAIVANIELSNANKLAEIRHKKELEALEATHTAVRLELAKTLEAKERLTKLTSGNKKIDENITTLFIEAVGVLYD